jgi:hypothetical protein
MEKEEYIFQHKYILGLTSLWICIPLILNIYENGFTKYNFLLFITCKISTIFWGYFFYGSLLHKLDRFFATFAIIILDYLALYKLNYINITLIICIPLFFLIARYYYLINQQNKVLIYHLIFRYFSFLLIINVLLINITNFINFILFSIFYLLHILKLTKNFEKIKNISGNNLEKKFISYYNAGIIETLLIISGIIFSQIVLIEYKKLI